MQKQINTAPIQQFAQLVKAAELSNQREVKLDIKTAKALSMCLLEVNAKLVQDYSALLDSLQKTLNNTSTAISMDGGSL